MEGLSQQFQSLKNLLSEEGQGSLIQLGELNSAVQLMQTLSEMTRSLKSAFLDLANTGIKTFTSSFGTAISSIATGAQKANEAFKQLGTTMIATIVKFVAEYLIQSAIMKVIGSAITATTIAMATSIAAAWLPAA